MAEKRAEDRYLNIFPQVELEEGVYEGQKMKSGVTVFKGIRYAKAPKGKLRWQAPQAIKPFKKVKKAHKFGSACPQAEGGKYFYDRAAKLADLPQGSLSWAPEDQKEDCLFLNIWSPKISSSARLPVMVWIHGGASVFGASHNPKYDGEKLAHLHNVVLVNINYRLGILGNFAHPLLSKESGTNSSGNYGLMDQVAALEWVKENIDSFGGNPYNVTIFGHSAGGKAVLNLMSSTAASGLFQKAIAQSPWDAEHHYRRLKTRTDDQDSAENIGLQIANELGIIDGENALKELRTIEPTALIDAAKSLGKPGTVFAPIIDGYMLEYHPFKILADGIHNKASLIVGLTANEADIFLALNYFESGEEYQKFLKSKFGDLSVQFESLYPASDDAYARRLEMVKLYADRHFLTPTLYAANEVANISDVWLYQYTYVDSHFSEDALRVKDTTIGAYHGIEVDQVFGNIDPTNQNHQVISDRLMKYWTNFAKNGDPNGEDLDNWDKFDPKDQNYLEINLEFKNQKKLRDQNFNLYKQIIDKLI